MNFDVQYSRLWYFFRVVKTFASFLILLSTAEQKRKVGDPILELLKHAFVLKVGKKSVAKAQELERLVDELIDAEDDTDPGVYSTLQLLVGLKNSESQKPDKEFVRIDVQRVVAKVKH